MIIPVLLALGAQNASYPAIIPQPISVAHSGKAPFIIDSTTQVRDPQNTFASKYLIELIERGARIKLKRAENLRLPGIEFDRAAGEPKEGYRLTVTSRGIKIRYSDDAGALYAVQTLRQLLPAGIDSKKGTTTTLTVPTVEITDGPRFQWRGMHLDVSRHFFPVSFIKRYIDYIAMMKMNVFHWHLVDDGGWRLRIDKYPKLTTVGAWRYGITDGWDQGKLRFEPGSGLEKYGGFYTKDEVREVVRYAAERFITVVPEIEMPGHAMPVFAGYPELGCLDQPKPAQEGQPHTNVFCAGNEQSFAFVEDVLTEVMELFPSNWIHIGGDEVWKGYWKRCSRCQAKMKAEGLKNEEELQSYFIRRVDKFLTEKGRRLVGWDEILEGGLAKGATVMSWRGVEGGIAAAKAGQDVVMSPTSHAYFDYAYEGQGTEHVYTFEPVPPSLTPEEAKRVLGGQANLWTEWIATEAKAEYMIWPRMAAMAEALWTPKDRRNLNEFLARLPNLIQRLDLMGANYYIPAPRVPLTAVIYTDNGKVTAYPEAKMPGTLRFTYGSKPVTAEAEEYKGPIYVVGAGQVVNFAYVTPSGRVGDTTSVVALKATPFDPPKPTPGWLVSIYEGSWTKVPDFALLKFKSQGVTNSVGVHPATQPENVGLRFEAYLKIETEGVYEFSLSSDDGSWLKIDHATVVDNDGLHGAVEKKGRVQLPEGWHRIEIGFFQAGGALSLTATMNGKPLDGLVYHTAPGK